MGSDCAYLISNSGGVNEYAVNHVNCLMYEPENFCEMVTKLNDLILNISLQKKLREEGNLTVKNFNWLKYSQ